MPRAKQPQLPTFRQHGRYGVDIRRWNAWTTHDSATKPSSSGHSMAGGAMKDNPQTVLRQGAMPSPKALREQGRSKQGCRRPTYLYRPSDYRGEQLERMWGLQTKLRALIKHKERKTQDDPATGADLPAVRGAVATTSARRRRRIRRAPRASRADSMAAWTS
ncbi:hypothetical protein HPB50_027653 [Hyalomma asiaticum]|nr:hypothetical protein HPB50_027653 [Hyalomma asiaticum]